MVEFKERVGELDDGFRKFYVCNNSPSNIRMQITGGSNMQEYRARWVIAASKGNSSNGSRNSWQVVNDLYNGYLEAATAPPVKTRALPTIKEISQRKIKCQP